MNKLSGNGDGADVTSAVALLLIIIAGLMISLGIWQLHRGRRQQVLIAYYLAARTMPAPVPWPPPSDAGKVLYRHAQITCVTAQDIGAIAGRNARNFSGWAHMMSCVLPEGRLVPVMIGWSNDPAVRVWKSGTVYGMIAPFAGNRLRLIADPPLSGLEANALPDPRTLPNHHLAYAVQWFAFAAIALIVNGVVLVRHRVWRGSGGA